MSGLDQRAWLGHRRIDLVECGSTNDEAAALARAGAAHGTIVIAERQTRGRGRDGRTWLSPAGGLYMSAVLRPALALAEVPPLTLAIGVGACEAAREHGADARLKWPNDLYAGGKKLGGILVEAQSQSSRLDSVVAGIGVNLATTPDLDTAAALGTVDRSAFIATLIARLEHWIDCYVARGISAIVPAWREHMMQGLALRAGGVVGDLAGLDDDGALLLRDGAGRIHRIRSGDVAIVS
ncbi:MAG TPA: biotin--[acetyl-CoA-carboxylase] ligase [Kofleriaceae bacterium]|jgi:BirA family biotin operon repressor/biotin-[acetyl-CoA-carboxylase] ligase